MQRRNFLAALSASLAASAQLKKKPTIMIRSGWQTVNIGDIAHTPGLLAVLEKNIPEADLILWPASYDRGVEPMLRRRFPKLVIAKGTTDNNRKPIEPELREAFSKADMLIHGSAASVGAQPQIDAWRKATGKPYGFFGVGFTIDGEAAGASMSEGLRTLLNGGSFLFTRETASLANVKKAGIEGPELGFAPDGTFSMDILDEPRGEAYLKESGLETGKFICLIPRLRFTPYHLIRKTNYTAEQIRKRTSVNDQHAEKDHAKLREAAIAFVRKTGGKVLLCPEMTYQLDIIDPLLYDPLPADVKPKVVRRKSYWLPDEASSVYKRAVAVVSSECHSPILAVAHGTPCMYVHQPEDGIKGRMWPDIGLQDWYFEIEDSTGEQIARRVLEIHAGGVASRSKARQAADYARGLQRDRAATIRKALTEPLA